jgi:hypothetical protein
MTNDRVFERHFIAFGVGIRLRTDSLSLVATLLPERLPVGWRPVEIHEREPPESLQYEVLTESGQVPYRLYAGTYLLAEATNTTDLVSALASHSERFVSEHAPDHLFVHAGVVGWEGRAVVMPGASFAGKTTLVQAWLEAGATYYSDEFAVLDRAGRVHPFARPLAIRGGVNEADHRVPVASLGAESGTTPIPIGLVLVTSYRAGAHWRPRRLTPALALLALMRHTIAARGNPEHSMPILKHAVSGGVAFAGVRGEARRLVSSIRQHAEAPI